MRIGFVNGCFDLFHAGHRRLLIEARKRCDYLIVAVNSDLSVNRLKGVLRPYEEWSVRVDNVMETGLVDAVIPFEGDEEALIKQIAPDVWIRGYDHFDDARAWTKDKPPTEIFYVMRIPELSTTEIARCRD